MQASPIQKIVFEKQKIFIKRDDLLHPHFSGNKARKLFYFLEKEFPTINKVISYGSMQSNAMYSLSVLAKMRGWKFEYYCRLNEDLLHSPKGNLKAALDNGMELKSFEEWRFGDELGLLSEAKIVDETLVVPEGGRCKEAEYGLKILAQEITQWANNIKELNIFLPSGTGTTALYLKKALFNSSIEVYTTPCVGDASYLKNQFFALEKDAKFHPKILNPPKKYRFGKLYSELFEVWQRVQVQTGIEFDLLYDPIGFQTLFSHKELFLKPLLYIHQGGLKGNETMLERYMQKFKKVDDIIKEKKEFYENSKNR